MLGILLLGVTGMLAARNRVRLGSSRFQTAYEEIRRYLRMTSTAELTDVAAVVGALRHGDEERVTVDLGRRFALDATERDALRHAIDDATSRLADGDVLEDEQAMRVWDVLDRALKKRFVAAWLIATEPPPPRRPVMPPDLDTYVALTRRSLPLRRSARRAAGKQIEAATRSIERWALESLLITERPPELFRLHVPNLMASYCALSSRPYSMLAHPMFARRTTAVSEIDLTYRLRLLGFPMHDGVEIYRWLASPRSRPAVGTKAEDVANDVREQSARVDRLGLRPGMSEAERHVAMQLTRDGDGDGHCTECRHCMPHEPSQEPVEQPSRPPECRHAVGCAAATARETAAAGRSSEANTTRV